MTDLSPFYPTDNAKSNIYQKYTNLFQISGIRGLVLSLGGGQDMATGDEVDCNLFMQFVVDADSERPLGSQAEVGSIVVLTVVLKIK